MVFTDFGKEQVAIMIGSDVSNLQQSYIAIGDGSGTEAVTNVTLVNEVSRFAITGSPDFTVNKKVSFQGDLNSVQFSGLTMIEWGMFASGGASTGSCWQREQLIGSIVGDGTIEIRIENSDEVQ